MEEELVRKAWIGLDWMNEDDRSERKKESRRKEEELVYISKRVIILDQSPSSLDLLIS